MSPDKKGFLNLASVLAAVPMAVYSIDQNGEIQSWSSGAEEIYGFSFSELQEVKNLPFLPEEERNRFKELIVKAIEGEVPQPEEMFRVGKSNNSIRVMSCFSPWKDMEGKNLGLVVFERPVLSQNQNSLQKENEIRWLRNLLMNAPAMIAIHKGPDHRYLLVNNLLKTFLDKGDLIGKTIREVWPQIPERDLIERYDNVFQHGREYRGYHIPGGRAGVGEKRYFNLINQPYFSSEGKIEGVLSFAFETTQEILLKQKLEERGEQLNLAVEATKLGIFDWKEDTSQVEWSLIAKTILCIESDSAPPITHFIEIAHSFHKDGVATALQQAFDPGKGVLDVEFQIQPQNGIERWIAVSGKAKFKKQGDKKTIVRFTGSILDITGRMILDKAKEASEIMFKGTFDNAAVGMCHIGLDGTWLRVNQRLCEILQYSEKKMKSMDWKHICHPEDVKIISGQFTKLIKGEANRYFKEVRFRCADGEYKWVHWTIAIQFSPTNSPIYCIGVIEDISERKKYEEELASQKQALIRSNNDLRQFAYAASHDLQEPLRMVASYTKFLQQRYQDKLDEKANQFIHFAVEGATRMQKLIRGLLEYSRLDRAEGFKEVDLNEVCKFAIRNLERRIEQNKARITYSNLPVIKGHFSQLTILFQNLISNALRYHRETKPPVIQIHSKKEEEQQSWRISFSDNGIGIENEYLDTIFVIFNRLHGRDEYGGGTGIGLALCKKIVERHGGWIEVESEPGKGSVFHCLLPRII